MFANPPGREDVLLHTKLSPPHLHRRVLSRPTLAAKLRESLDYRLTHVHAGTGYSKTTALATLATGESPIFWYTVGETDADPQRFLSYLIAAFRLKLPDLSDLPQAVLQEGSIEGNSAAWLHALDALLNALQAAIQVPSLLVIDDYHLTSRSPQIGALLERFVAYGPAHLHTVISTRHALDWPSLLSWRAKDEVLEINRQALAFRPEEIEALFRDVYGFALSPEELTALIERTEGWPIALQLVWQGLRDTTSRSASELVLEGSTSLSALFSYLAHDVLGAQPPEIAVFLRETAILRELTPEACDAVTGRSASEADSRESSALLLGRLLELDLFVLKLGEGHYRYHHLFHDFLRQEAERDKEGTLARHRKAACFYEAEGDYEEAIYHWLQAGDLAKAASAIERAGGGALRAGWLDTVAKWIDALPPEVLSEHPLLQAYLADVYRMRSRFSEALAWYAQAEQWWRARDDRVGVARALRGQALVYLDTVRPTQAEKYLEEALRLTEGFADRQARARLLELLAENKLNMGKPDEAEALLSEARALREEGPAEDALSVRVKLRTGKLEDAQTTLESWVEAERKEADRGQTHPPRAHRETLLILSLIHSFRGQGEAAFALAQESIALGERLESPFITAVGHTRLGHAWQVRQVPRGYPPGTDQHEEAIRCYQAGIALGDKLSVRRMRAEVMWGMTRAYGFSGDLASAQQAAVEGAETGRWAGDAWIVAHIELMLGASYVLAGRHDNAVEVLTRVLAGFRECGDSLGRAAARLWLALAYHASRKTELAASSVEDSLALCEAHGYGFLFTAPTLAGPPDPRCLVPLLLLARGRRYMTRYVNGLLAELGLPNINAHPGYQLRVYTLGTFRAFRGETEIEQHSWQRDKARQLFQLLLMQKGQWLQRDEIIDRLWPNLSPDAGGRDFKVALNALNRALEPNRPADAPFSFVVREGTAYRIRPEADLWIDSAAFEQECMAALKLAEGEHADEQIAQLRAALLLYNGSFLQDSMYEEWSAAERERLTSLFLRAADRLAGILVEQGRNDEAADTCTRILAHDPCWERAYRLLMLAYARQGDSPLALRTYQRCAGVLLGELGVTPSSATTALYETIKREGHISVTAL